MIVHIKNERGVINTNIDFVNSVPEFMALIEDDTLGINYLAYVAYLTDVSDDNIYATLPEEVRKRKLIDKLHIDEKLLKTEKVKAALKEYKDFCKHNIAYQFISDYNLGLRKMAEYVRGVDVNDDNAKKVSDVIGDMPKLLKGREEINKAGSKEQAKKGIVRGGKATTLNEQMN